jgi:streptogramin lyase
MEWKKSMKAHNFWKRTPFYGAGTRVMLHMILALAMLIAGGDTALAATTGTPRPALANVVTLSHTLKQPWGVALDGSGHIWVAEPNCDSSPVCVTPPGTGEIGEYNAATLASVQDFTPPAPAVYNPIFLALDHAGNIWFTDPSHGAIGELIPASNTWKEFSIASAFPGAIPYDLVFDQYGHLWFTDYKNGSIDEFDPVAGKLIGETPTPTPNTILYGITVAPNGKIWFAENNTVNIGSFVPPATGALTQSAITEYPMLTNGQHLITVDKSENVWFSTGFAGQIGELPAGSTTGRTFCVSNNVSSPHISGIGVDSAGRVWFDDANNARVGYLDPTQYNNDCATHSLSGVAYTTVGSSAHPHDGLIVDSQGNVFFTEQYQYALGKIAAGTMLQPPSNSYPPGPTAKNWYFAEGRVGAGFNEFITLSNPDVTNACIVDLQYLLENGAPVVKKITIPPGRRWTESVTSDLGTSVNGTGISVATMVTNDPVSPCLGVVSERPMYFNYHGDVSGSDVVGATHTARSFYFADIASGGGYTSYITILNPPGGQPASVTATYYANGTQVGSQSISVNAGARGTIAPGALAGLPQHCAAVVTASQPVVVERPVYFSHINGGIAGSVSGASSVVGSQILQHEWFLAEGYAGTSSSGGRTQENLVISNLDAKVNAAANVTINLEYLDGTRHAFMVAVQPRSQVIWNVNAQGVGATSPEVSADVTSTGAGIVVEREMFFQYVHTLNGQTLHASGGTDVTGQIGTYRSYSFAEGYSNKGYNEWLTLQNPTANLETIYLTMINGDGNVYTQSFAVAPNTRFTQDISALTLAHLVQPGDDFHAYEVSITVQTLDGSLFVAERPMYWNTAGSSFATQGGNDAFGYNGN